MPTDLGPLGASAPTWFTDREGQMSVTEFQRHQIFQWYEEAMGPERAAIMMDLLPPVGWGDIATKTDLVVLEGRLRGEMAELRGELKLAIAQAMRTMVFTVLASTISLAGLVLATAQLG